MEEIPRKENTPVSFGSKYLSHSFDIYQSGVARGPHQRIALLDDALYELGELEGGQEAWTAAQKQFEAERGRAVGDIEEARRGFLERNPAMAEYAASQQFVDDKTIDEKHWLAHHIAGIITKTHNPRTLEYLEAYHKEHRGYEEAFDRQQAFTEFQEILDALPEHLKGPMRNFKDEYDRLATLTEELEGENETLRNKLRDC